MSYQETIISSIDSYPLSVRVFDCENPKAVIKIIHGMEEHQSRYEDFATFLQSNGYVVITSDMRGHGKNAPKLCHIADKYGDTLLIEDEKIIRNFINSKYPLLPVYLFAHSMGAINARILIQTESEKYEKLILSGYPCYNGAVNIAIGLANLCILLKGRDKRAKILTSLSLGPYSKAIKDRKTDLDWLSYNEENVINYDKDPLCGVEFTISSFKTLFKLMKKLHDFKNCKNINKNLKILLVNGIDDPCVGNKKNINDSISTLKKYGFEKIELKEFENMRHEILNETNNKIVYDTILNFLIKK